jgi:adenosylmethionine-8-amino-7-oxononanoate aminotransferase
MTLSERDQKYLWHPHTQHKKTAALLLQLKGEGAFLGRK